MSDHDYSGSPPRQLAAQITESDVTTLTLSVEAFAESGDQILGLIEGPDLISQGALTQHPQPCRRHACEGAYSGPS